MLLFSNRRRSTAHDVPSYVQIISDRFGGSLGSASDIVLRRSVLPFYFPFHSKVRCRDWLGQIYTSTAPFLKARLGLSPARFGAAHPLKACPQCLLDDVSKFDIAYWHLAHQLPGVLVCPVHSCSLLVASDKVTGRDRFGWVLPFQARLEPLLPTFEAGPLEIRLAELSHGLWNVPCEFEFDLTRLGLLYQQRMVELDLCDRRSKKVNCSRFTQSLILMLKESEIVSVWPWLAGPHNTVARHLLRLRSLTGARDSRHPLNHGLMQILLFGSWSAFLRRYEHADSETLASWSENDTRSVVQAPISTSPKFPLRHALLQSLNAGHSVTHAAKTHGITVNTAKIWAAKEGISTSVRPKILKPSLRMTLKNMLASGAEKTEAATAVGVSVVTVTRVLLTEPGLHDLWTNSRHSKAQEQARSAWTHAMTAFPEAASNHWRALEPGAYAWLYRNDRCWLQTSVRERKQPVPSSQFRRDWSQRDDVLAQAVLSAALDFVKNNASKRLTLGELCSSVKGLRAVQSALPKLPRTRAAIQEVCTGARSAAFKKQLAPDGTLFES